MIVMDLIYIFLHSSDSFSYLSLKHLLFTWLQYCSTPIENEALAYCTQIQNSRSVISSVFLLVFFLIGFKPDRSRRIFKGEKILSTPSFGGEVKPSVPCRRFAACKRPLNGVEVVISAKLPDNILAHSSTFRR